VKSASCRRVGREVRRMCVSDGTKGRGLQPTGCDIMITVRIGNAERPLKGATEAWITEQIDRCGNVGVCLQVRIKEPQLDMTLSTPGCGGAGGNGRDRFLDDHEARVFELWERMHMDSAALSAGNIAAFLRQLERTT
jgi:hypothetical protein